MTAVYYLTSLPPPFLLTFQVPARSPRTLLLYDIPHRGDHLPAKGLDLPLVVFRGPEDERVHPVLQREARELLGPLRDRPFQQTFSLRPDPAGDVVEALDLLRSASGL